MGDTVTEAARPTATPFPGFQEVKPMVFCGVFPIDSADYENLRDALEKLQLNDSAFTYEPETSTALGFGFRCGYLGLLHMEIVQERLEREYGLNLITTAPSVVYKVFSMKGEEMLIDNPAKLPAAQNIEHLEEPVLTCHIHVPDEYLGAILKLCQDRRGVQKDIKYLGSSGKRVQVTYGMPLSEVVFDFFDKLKSVSPRLCQPRLRARRLPDGGPGQAGRPDQRRPRGCAVASSCTGSAPTSAAATVCAKLKEVIPKQMYEVAIQAAIGAEGHLRAKPSPRCARTCSPSATAATSAGSASSSRSRRRARSG